MFGLQPIHILAIAVVALLIFGPSRLPEISRAFGRSIREFRDAASSVQDEVKKGLEDTQKTETDSTKTDAQPKT
jgi:sec-independent protein translocase protein TatA